MKITGMKLWLCAAAAALLCSVAAFFAGREYLDRRCSDFTGNAEIYIYPAMNVADVLETLDAKGIVKRRGSIVRSLRRENLCRRGLLPGSAELKPGHYTVSAGVSARYFARMIRNGWQTPVNLVLSGSMRQKRGLARKISSQMMMDTLTVMDALRDSAVLAGYGFTPENVFALFMPDTYQVYWTDSMKVVLDRQKAAYDAFWTDENKKKAEIQGLSPMEVSVLASIVRSESNHVPEYPLIAGVYLNRLHLGMKLQADPTIAFCYGYTLNRIMKKHLKVDSPYNTYMHEGLPPAPICVPGRDAMDAVLNPQGGRDLFFCASPEFDGTHIFAATYSEHLKNARAFQKALNVRLREREKAASGRG